MSQTRIIGSTHDAASAIAGLRAKAEAPEPEETQDSQEIEPAEGAEPEPEREETPDPASGDHDSEGEPEETPASAEPPSSWPKDQIGEWQGLSPSVQEKILAREAEFQSAISEKGRKTAEAAEAANRQKTEYEQRARQLDEVFPALVDRMKTRWEKVDWKKLAAEDPEQVVKLQVELQEDQAIVNRAAQLKAQADLDHQTMQVSTLIERNPQYRDRDLLAKEASEVERFLIDLGYDKRSLAMITAVEFEAARDAMKFRKASRTATQPAKQPPQKTAKPGARPPQAEPKKKALEEARQKLSAMNRSGAGRNQQIDGLAQMIALKRNAG